MNDGRRLAAERRWHDPAVLLRHLGITRPADIDVETIARYCNARVSYQPLRGCEGRIVGHRGRAVIVVNRGAHPYRQRFTIAHELGHWMFDRAEIAHVFTEGTWSETSEGPPAAADHPHEVWYEDRPEQRANRWAAELLMPEGWFTPDAAGREISFDTARDLAQRYRTSLTATALRLIDLGSTPAMLVRSHRGQRGHWFRHGAGVPHRLWPHPEPKTGTLAYELLAGRQANTGPTAVAADGWIQTRDAWWFRVSEDSLLVPSGDVLTLLSWPDDAQLRATFTPAGTWLPWQPGKNARARLLQCLCNKWAYRRRHGKPGETVLGTGNVLETNLPTPQRLVAPPSEALDTEGFRRLVDEVARHKGVQRGAILRSMLRRPKK